MPASATTEPVQDSVSKANDELAFGSDPEFQRRWRKFERGVWIFFTLLLVLDVLGVFGRRPLAKARMRAGDASAEVTYARVERHGTPSYLTVRFGPSSVHDGKVRLWVSESLVKVLGTSACRRNPNRQPSRVRGILYIFPRALPPAAQFALQPTSVGPASISLQVPGRERLSASIFVMP